MLLTLMGEQVQYNASIFEMGMREVVWKQCGSVGLKMEVFLLCRFFPCFSFVKAVGVCFLAVCVCLILYKYCKEKFFLRHSWEFKA